MAIQNDTPKPPPNTHIRYLANTNGVANHRCIRYDRIHRWHLACLLAVGWLSAIASTPGIPVVPAYWAAQGTPSGTGNHPLGQGGPYTVGYRGYIRCIQGDTGYIRWYWYSIRGGYYSSTGGVYTVVLLVYTVYTLYIYGVYTLYTVCIRYHYHCIPPPIPPIGLGRTLGGAIWG